MADQPETTINSLSRGISDRARLSSQPRAHPNTEMGNYSEVKKTAGREAAAFPCAGHTRVCQPNQHLTPANGKKPIAVALRRLSIPRWKSKRPVPKQHTGEEAAAPCGRGNREGTRRKKRRRRRKRFLAAAESQHTDASPKHKALAKEKHRL